MPITQYLGILFSRPSWRYWLLFAVVAHLIFGGYALVNDLVKGAFNLSLVMDVTQYALVEAALILLFISSSKQEGDRYSHDTRFYLKQYGGEIGRFLFFKKTDQNKLQASVGLTHTETQCFVGAVKASKPSPFIISQSVCEYLPSKPLPISALKFNLSNEWYDLPWFMSEGALDRILKRFNALDKSDYNGHTLAVKGLLPSDDGLTIVFNKASYYAYLATNMLPEVKLPGGLTFREMVEPGPELTSFETSMPANHLGLSCLMWTQDGFLVVPKRSSKTNVFKGQLSPSVSGASNTMTCFDRKKKRYSPLQWLLKETHEELPFLVGNSGVKSADLEKLLENTRFLGMTRELRRCGKPEVFMELELPLTSTQVAELLLIEKDSQAHMSDVQKADYNENETFMLICGDEIYAGIYQIAEQSNEPWFSWLTDKKKFKNEKTFKVLIKYEQQELQLSESLVVNLILSQLHY
ncbi:MAG: hypothetical protein IBX55_18690 [Methyloprofundus sp.]|nr:hypothetical protein [Methyloprofundus sp.]